MGGWRVTRGEESGWVKRVEGGRREWGGGWRVTRGEGSGWGKMVKKCWLSEKRSGWVGRVRGGWLGEKG